MPYHHIAFASRDTTATHAFYNGVMGFELVKVVVGPTPEGGWAKHFFYDTGGDELIAFWELHSPAIAPVKGDISKSLGLPAWVNHIAFDAPTLDNLAVRRERWLTAGHDVIEVDHGFCTSIYLEDPNGILVEFCCTTSPFTDEDKALAARRIADPQPSFDEEPKVTFHRAAVTSASSA
jgi:catechol 2,3-dioxygenase-like lactoylglutathione lyase family enzyme